MINLKQSQQWVNYVFEPDPKNPDKPKKIPKNPKSTSYNARVNDPATWGNLEQATSNVGKIIKHRIYYDKNDRTKFETVDAEIAGIGFMFADGICGIDVDDCMDDPERKEQAQTILQLMDTYTELSPSGTGYHIIFRCDLTKIPQKNGKLDPAFYTKNTKKDLECYFSGLTNRFFTYTGEAVNSLDIEERTEQVLQFLNLFMIQGSSKPQGGESPPIGVELSDDEIIKKARDEPNGKFIKLFDDGDWSGYRSQSEADHALCLKIGFYRCDRDTIDRIFRKSKLFRPKWDERHGADTYGNMTINSAIARLQEAGRFYSTKKQPGRPKKDKNKSLIPNNVDSDEFITISGVREYLKQIGVTVRYNETTRKSEILGIDNYNNNYIVNSLPIIIYDQLNLMYEKCPKSDVQDFLRVILMDNAYNPALEIIESGKWDGTDRLPELFQIMRIADNDRLSKTLVFKWIWQNLSMLRNNRGEFGADGLLVLQGAQGIGKTSFARKMALKNEFFGEGLQLDLRDKDTVIQAVSCWIGELGEIESTFKSDISALKAFISRATDKYRVPYGRTAEDNPRRTSFIGTCNSDEYLIDETGNRRYWTVPIPERIDLDALAAFDTLQLYLQIDEQYARNNVQGFRLKPDEITQLAERNGQHEKQLKGEFEIRDILFRAEKDNLIFKEMTITEFKEYYSALKIYSANQIGVALKKIGITSERKRIDGELGRFAMLPVPQNILRPSDALPM